MSQEEMSTEELIQSLRGTAWAGPVTAQAAFFKLTFPYRVVFLSELSSDGTLLYFHRLTDSDAPWLLKIVTQGCPHTPRRLALAPSSVANPAIGTISVFKCADSELEESKHSADRARRPKHTLENVRIFPSSDRNALKINARIAIINVTYEFTRQAMPADTTTAALRSWLERP